MPTKRCCCNKKICFCFAVPSSCTKLCTKTVDHPLLGGPICEAGALSTSDLLVTFPTSNTIHTVCEEPGKIDGSVSLTVHNNTGDVYYARPYGPPSDTYYNAYIGLSISVAFMLTDIPSKIPDSWSPIELFNVDGSGVPTSVNLNVVGPGYTGVSMRWHETLDPGESWSVDMPIRFIGCFPPGQHDTIFGGIFQPGSEFQPAGCRKGWVSTQNFHCIRNCECTRNQEPYYEGDETYRPVIGGSEHPIIPSPLMICNIQNPLVRPPLVEYYNRKRCGFGVQLGSRFPGEVTENLFPENTLVITSTCSKIEVSDFKIATPGSPFIGLSPSQSVEGNNTNEVTVTFEGNYGEYITFCLELTQESEPEAGEGCCEELDLLLSMPIYEEQERWSRLLFPKQICEDLFPCIADTRSCEYWNIFPGFESCEDFNTYQCDDPP